jgi:hypothetical protein
LKQAAVPKAGQNLVIFQSDGVPPALSTVADAGSFPGRRRFRAWILSRLPEYLEAATSYGFGALKAADPLKKTDAGREAAGVGMLLLFRSRTP